ncbi:hypothetical protein RIF29_27532 [Crotalaria pallida]|uniref:Uncharacterized protein n=1 Tax=Crotalaria pallida TaxID=3830 RepID=A0AAN9EP86_CROPI
MVGQEGYLAGFFRHVLGVGLSWCVAGWERNANSSEWHMLRQVVTTVRATASSHHPTVQNHVRNLVLT